LTLVVDSSIAASWALPDENSPAATRALFLALDEGVTVPSVFWHELRNVFLVNERRKRLTAEETQNGLSAVGDLLPQIDDSEAHGVVLDLARKYSMSAYDASYLELALRSGAMLATLDHRLARAALSENLSVISEL